MGDLQPTYQQQVAADELAKPDNTSRKTSWKNERNKGLTA
jgi:hypothetical protein